MGGLLGQDHSPVAAAVYWCRAWQTSVIVATSAGAYRRRRMRCPDERVMRVMADRSRSGDQGVTAPRG